MDVIKIVGHNLVRDLDSKAILATDNSAVERYRRQSKVLQDAKQKSNEIEDMKKDMSEIKELLNTLLARIS